MTMDMIEFWRQAQFTSSIYIHPADLPHISDYVRWNQSDGPTDFESYTRGSRFHPEDDRPHFSLLPVPFVGDVRNAPVILLMLNPGLQYADYWAEFKVPDFKDRLQKNLHQDFTGTNYPFFYLDPTLCWHPGFIWWESKLRDIAKAITKSSTFKRTYREALELLAKNVACIELFPYHSVSFRDHGLLDKLPSVKCAKAFVQSLNDLDVSNGSRTLIVTRQVAQWGLQKTASNKNLHLYSKGQARGASLSTATAGGKAILRQLGFMPP